MKNQSSNGLAFAGSMPMKHRNEVLKASLPELLQTIGQRGGCLDTPDKNGRSLEDVGPGATALGYWRTLRSKLALDTEFNYWVAKFVRWERFLRISRREFLKSHPHLGGSHYYGQMIRGNFRQCLKARWVERFQEAAKIIVEIKPDWETAPLKNGPGPIWPILQARALACDLDYHRVRLGIPLSRFCTQYGDKIGSRRNFYELKECDRPPENAWHWCERMLPLLQKLEGLPEGNPDTEMLVSLAMTMRHQ